MMERYHSIIAKLHTVMLYDDVGALIQKATSEAYKQPYLSNHEFICRYLENEYDNVVRDADSVFAWLDNMKIVDDIAEGKYG